MKTKYVNYFIEIRYFGKAKKKFKLITNEIDDRFNLKNVHKVPHITLIQSFKTDNQKKLVSDFKRICSKQKPMKFVVNRIGIFPFYVVYVKVIPDKNLLKFRSELMNAIKSYCHIKNITRKYKPHTTIALRMGFFKFFRIWFYLRKREISFENNVIRATLLKGSRILYEYDFTSKRLLNRSHAKSSKELSKTFLNLKKKKT